MASKLNPSRSSPARISSQSLQKFMEQENLSRSPPRLWLDHPNYCQTHQDQPILTLTHPILRKLESCTTTIPKQVNQVCADLGLVKEGGKAHAWVIKLGIELDLYVRNSLIHIYALCGRHWDARVFFDLSSISDVVTCNTMINGCVKNEELGFARWLFDGMKERDVFSWNSMIGGYVGFGNMEAAKELFDKMPCRDFVSWNCMIDGYARVGNVVTAREFFDWMPCPNVVAWNTMLALYVRSKDYNGCLGLFDK